MAQFRSYLIAVKTSDLKDANTDATTIKISLIGVFGKTKPYLLNHSSNISCPKIDADPVLPPEIKVRDNLFERNNWDSFKITTDDVGTLLRIQIKMDDTNAWNLEQAVVIPYNHDGKTLNLSMRRSFTVNRWFDSKDFDGLKDLEIDSEETLQAPEWQQTDRIKTAKTMVMRYENSGVKELSTNFKFHYSIVQGVAIEESQTKETKTDHTRTHSWEVSVTESAGAEGIGSVSSEQKYSGSDVCTRAIAKSCSNKYGATTTTSMIQEQEIPVTLPPNSVGTLIVQVYQTAVNHQVSYGDYQMPVTVYDGTIDLSFKLYPEILNQKEAWEKAKKLAGVAGVDEATLQSPGNDEI